MIKVLFKLAGCKIRVIGTDQSHVFFIFPVLKRCLDHGVHVQTVLDIGASDVRWSLDNELFEINSQSKVYLLIKVQNEYRGVLEQLIHKYRNIEYANCSS